MSDSNSKKPLGQHRKKASELSLGLSSQHIYRRFLEVLEDLERVPPSRKILDFGAGRGEFTRLLLKSGQNWEVSAIDLMEAPEDLSKQVTWHSWDLNEAFLQDWKDSFDVIVAPEIIEHLENPRFIARQWFEWLKPGGCLIMSTPNNESWRSLLSLLVRGHHVAFTESSYPAHITALLLKDLERVLLEAGFSRCHAHYTNHGVIPKLSRWSWQQVSAGWLKGKRYSDNVLVSAVKSHS